jgi:hypothetical protein
MLMDRWLDVLPVEVRWSQRRAGWHCNRLLLKESMSTRFQLVLLSTLAILSWPAIGLSAEAPIIDNDQVEVFETAADLPPAANDFVMVPLAQSGTATFGHKGEIPGAAGSKRVVIEVKEHALAAIPNTSGYPAAFPRPHVVKLFENDHIIVWAYRWNPGEATPMHFHDKNVVVVYEEDTALTSTTPDGKVVENDYKNGDVRFNLGNRTHSELLVRGTGSAVMTELK